MTTSDKIRANVEYFLITNQISFSIDYITFINDKEWGYNLCQFTFSKPGAVFTGQFKSGLAQLTVPDAASVLHCVILDSQSINTSFLDWCADYGYNTDSRKDEAIYDACVKIGLEFRHVFTYDQVQQLQEMLLDY